MKNSYMLAFRAIPLFLMGTLASPGLVGCAATTSVSMDAETLANSTFIIEAHDDPLDVSSVICAILKEHGVRAQIQVGRGTPPPVEDQPVGRYGSGFFVSSTGSTVTNLHVVDDAEEVVVRLQDGTWVQMTVLVGDASNDLALLAPQDEIQVERWFRLGQFKDCKLGDHVWVAGYPLTSILGSEPRLTDGSVSAKTGLSSDPTRFQVSAPIQPGNSGGPIFRDDYKVVGIATEKLSDLYAVEKTASIPQNVNFGVKVEYLNLLLASVDAEYCDLDGGYVDSLEAATEATAIVAVNVGKVPEMEVLAAPPKRIIITFSYKYYWDVFHNTLTHLQMRWVDESTGAVLASATFNGGSLSGYKSIVGGAVKSILKKAAAGGK